jgi:plastocyanin domain-containing protein
VFNINNAAALAGVNVNIHKPISSISCVFNPSCFSNSDSKNDFGIVTDNPVINIEQTGYNPSNLTIKAGSKITLNLKNTGGSGCTQSFIIPSLGIQKLVPLGSSDTIEFTAPSEPGELAFMCSMGMFRGSMKVI